MNETILVPATVAAPCLARGRLGFGFGRRFFFLFLCGLLWIIPGFWNRTFLYGVAAWDCLLLLAWITDYLWLPKPRQLAVQRRWLSTPSLAVTSQVELELGNQGRVAVRASITDDLPAALRAEVAVLELNAGAGRPGRACYSIHPGQRGDIRAGKAYLRYGSVLEICERWCTADLRQVVRIFPNLEEVRRQNIYLTRSRQIELEKRLLRQRGMGREFESLREYRDGDEFRDICWTATARRGKLVTKLNQMERSQPVWIVLDAGRLLRARVEDLSKMDYAANAALGLAQLAIYSGDRVGLLAYGRRPLERVPLGRGASHLRHILDRLALVEAEICEADHLRAAGMLLALQKRRALIVWITDLAETAMTPEVVEGASHLLSRHLVLFMVIGQPDLGRVAVRRPENPQEMFQSVAALDMVQRRELLLAKLCERGALAMETAPGDLSAAVLNHYLMVKERSLL
ncbi:MAG: DUF58 domain-containing protein [Terriglobales bacterium]